MESTLPEPLLLAGSRHSRKLLWYNCGYGQYNNYDCSWSGGAVAGTIIASIVAFIVIFSFFYLISVCWRRRQLAAQGQYGYGAQPYPAGTYPAQPSNYIGNQYGNSHTYPFGYPPQGPTQGYPVAGQAQGYPVQSAPNNYPPTFVAHIKSDFHSIGSKFGSGKNGAQAGGSSSSATAAGVNGTEAGASSARPAAQQDVQMTEIPLDTPTGQHRPQGPVV